MIETEIQSGQAPPRVFQFKVTLQGFRPPIWRRVQVSEDCTLGKLHVVLQVAMGWHDGHLPAFRIGRDTTYTNPQFADDQDAENEDLAHLKDVVTGEKFKMLYEYDFGDSWEHELLLEKILAAEPGAFYPRCLTGKRACPPEDCGGVWGYEKLLEALLDPNHPEHADLSEWMGGPFDPNTFEIEAVNAALVEAFAPRKSRARRKT